MNKTKKVLIIILIILLVALGTIGVLYFSKKDGSKVNEIKQEDIIEDYGYSIRKNDSKVKKEKFKELKEILSASEIDYDAYATKVAEIFAIDVYDLNSKVNKYDVGGLEYVLPEKKDSLKMVLQDTLYNNLQDNTDGNRKQELPEVTAANAVDSTTGTYQYNNVNYEPYIIKVSIDYKKDLGYDKNVSVTIIKKDNKLFVVAIEP